MGSIVVCDRTTYVNEFTDWTCVEVELERLSAERKLENHHRDELLDHSFGPTSLYANLRPWACQVSPFTCVEGLPLQASRLTRLRVVVLILNDKGRDKI